MKILRIGTHTLIVAFLTIVSQIGGFIYLVSVFCFNKNSSNVWLKRVGIFFLMYITFNQFILPFVAPLAGREKIKELNSITAAMPLTKWLNRNYVKPELNKILQEVSKSLDQNQKGIKLVYLDANFPFFDGFPLLPHLSHNDGNKVDLSFIYENKQNIIVNNKPSRSGYGIFENPLDREENTTEICKSKGYWHYDYPKFLTFGKLNHELKISERANRFLISELLKHQEIEKIFIEPHLKKRLKINNGRIRFHGCAAVRHDDHIHVQIKKR